jgi:hypothetical protein
MYKIHFGTPRRLQNTMLQNNIIVLVRYPLERISFLWREAFRSLILAVAALFLPLVVGLLSILSIST